MEQEERTLTLLVQPSAAAKAAEAKEETKEQPRSHSRPPSIQTHHRLTPSALHAASVSPLPLSSPPVATPSPRSPGSQSSARSSLRNLFGRGGNQSSVAPFTPSPRSDDEQGSSVAAGEQSQAEVIGVRDAGRIEEEKESEGEDTDQPSTQRPLQAISAWSEDASARRTRAQSATDGDAVQPFSAVGQEESVEPQRSRAATLSQRLSTVRAEPSAIEDEADSDPADFESKYDEEPARVISHEPIEPPHSNQPPLASSPQPPTAAEDIPDLFSDLLITSLPPSSSLPPPPAELQALLLSSPAPALDVALLDAAAVQALAVGRWSLDELRAAELERERARLEAAREELHVWKEREWRVWKEEERVWRLLAVEDNKAKEAARAMEDGIYATQQAEMSAEVERYHALEGRLLRSLLPSVVTVQPMPEPAPSPPLSLVDARAKPAVPGLHVRFTALYAHTPRLLSLHVHALRAIKNKLPTAFYHIRVAILPSLSSDPLTFEGAGRSQCQWPTTAMTREPQKHGGNWSDSELLFSQSVNRLMLACPSAWDSRAEMVLRLELLQLATGAGSSRESAVGWGAFPLVRDVNGSWELVHGLHRVPLLTGPVDPSVTTWRAMHARMSADLSCWLCNLYFHAERGEDRVDDPHQYAVDALLTSTRPDGPPSISDQAPTDIAEPAPRPRVSSSKDGVGKKRADSAHVSLVKRVRELDGTVDVNGPNVVLSEKDESGWRRMDLSDSVDWTARTDGDGTPGWRDRELSVRLLTRRRRRRSIAADAAQLQTSSTDYAFAVGGDVSPAAGSQWQRKARFAFSHLDSCYHLTHPLSWRCVGLALCMVLALWGRLFLHYFGQWVFVSSVVQSPELTCGVLSCELLSATQLSTGQALVLAVVGTLIGQLVWALLVAAVWAVHRRSRLHVPLPVHTVLLCLGASLTLDPFVVNSASLYHADAISTLLAVLLSFSTACVGALLTWLYVLHCHADGALLDTYHRLSAAPALYIPGDYEMDWMEVQAVLDDSRQWRGEMGERRRIRIRIDDRPAGRSLYVSVIQVDADEETLAPHRQFMLRPDGDAFELFDSADLSQPPAAAGRSSVAAGTDGQVSAQATDAYLARLLKGRGKVQARSPALMWQKVREHFGFVGARSRGATTAKAQNRADTFMQRNGTVRGPMAMAGGSLGVRGRNLSNVAAARIGTFGGWQ